MQQTGTGQTPPAAPARQLDGSARPGEAASAERKSSSAMDIKTSLEQVLQSQNAWGKSFFRSLFQRCPEAKEFFRKVSVERQAALLTMQLSVVEVYHSTRSPAAEEYLKVLGTKHCDRGIPRELFPDFRDALLDSLQRFHGHEWSADLAEQWGAAIDAAVDKMLEGYAQRFLL